MDPVGLRLVLSPGEKGKLGDQSLAGVPVPPHAVTLTQTTTVGLEPTTLAVSTKTADRSTTTTDRSAIATITPVCRTLVLTTTHSS